MKHNSDKTVSYWARWFCLPVALIALFMGIGLLCHYSGLNYFQLHGKAIGGAIVAILWTPFAFALAPEYRLRAASVAFIVGACLAWSLLGTSYDIDYGGTNRLPTYITWASGTIGLAIVWSINRIWRKPNTH